TRSKRDWSSDVCSSDLVPNTVHRQERVQSSYADAFFAIDEHPLLLHGYSRVQAVRLFFSICVFYFFVYHKRIQSQYHSFFPLYVSFSPPVHCNNPIRAFRFPLS